MFQSRGIAVLAENWVPKLRGANIYIKLYLPLEGPDQYTEILTNRTAWVRKAMRATRSTSGGGRLVSAQRTFLCAPYLKNGTSSTGNAWLGRWSLGERGSAVQRSRDLCVVFFARFACATRFANSSLVLRFRRYSFAWTESSQRTIYDWIMQLCFN